MTYLFAFLTTIRPFSLTLHLLSVAVGFGGTTVADLLLMKFLKDGRISPKEHEVMAFLTGVIYPAFFVIALSGLLLYLPEYERFNASPAFAFKMLVTLILFVNGFLLHTVMSPNMMLMFNAQENPQEVWVFKLLRKLAFAMGAVSIISWYTAFLVAMLKKQLLFSFATWMSIYVIVVLVGIGVSQVVERKVERLLKEADPPCTLPPPGPLF
jgi:branched-subunit amino acid ABC-type transport system permease component